MANKNKWKTLAPQIGNFGPGNCVLDADGFFISYAPDTSGNMFGAGDNDGGPEMALFKDGVYLILNGDHRSAYENLVEKGYDACRAYYDENAPTCRSSYSEDWKLDRKRA